MSPRKLRRLLGNLMDQSNTSTSNRSRTRSSITSDKKTSPHNKIDLKNQEKDQTSMFLSNNSQQKKARTTRFLKKELYLKESKECYASKKSALTQNHESKVNEDDVHNNSLVDLSNISYDLSEQSPMQFKDSPIYCKKIKQFKKSPVQLSANFDINGEEKNINTTITPKCSPISVMLTLSRTSKTPKRSPVNLASPKVHLEVPFRLSKTPRKLQLFSNSPTKSSSLDKSLQNRKNINNNIQNSTLGNISLNDVNRKSNKLRKSRTSSENLKLMFQRSSKSPKIILKLPSSKSKIRASKKKLDNQENGNISVHKLRSSKKNVSKKVSAFSNKNDNNKSLSREESQLELTLTNVKDLSKEYKEIMLKKPIVLLERIPLLDSFSVLLKTQSNQHLMDTTLDVAKHVQKQLFKSLSSLKHSTSYINHKYPNKTEENILSKSFNNMKNVELNNTCSIVSSTPISSRSSDFSVTPLSFTNERVRRNISEDDMKNSTNDMNSINDNQNNTVVIENEEIPVADETYDLFEPRTPHLRQRFKKSATIEVDNDNEEIKKVVKIRFTTPKSQMEKVQSHNNVAVRKTPRVKYVTPKRSHSLLSTPTSKSTSNCEYKRSMSISNINTTPRKNSNKKEKTPSSTYSQVKSNTETEEKKDIKTQSVKKKIPNFVEIHKQMFAKMESVVDNKKRVIQQHKALVAKTPKVLRIDKNNMKKFRPIGTKDESYNRYGFRVKKADATNIILKKQHTNVQKRKREENKAFLKGVRTNRRFELLMKMRKISG